MNDRIMTAHTITVVLLRATSTSSPHRGPSPLVDTSLRHAAGRRRTDRFGRGCSLQQAQQPRRAARCLRHAAAAAAAEPRGEELRCSAQASSPDAGSAATQRRALPPPSEDAVTGAAIAPTRNSGSSIRSRPCRQNGRRHRLGPGGPWQSGSPACMRNRESPCRPSPSRRPSRQHEKFRRHTGEPPSPHSRASLACVARI